MTKGMMRFVDSDQELQIILARELAHITEDHIGKKTANSLLGAFIDGLITYETGQQSGIFTQIGAMEFSQDFEREADYVGMYILARPGISTSGGSNFWRRLAAEMPATNDR